MTTTSSEMGAKFMYRNIKEILKLYKLALSLATMAEKIKHISGKIFNSRRQGLTCFAVA